MIRFTMMCQKCGRPTQKDYENLSDYTEAVFWARCPDYVDEEDGHTLALVSITKDGVCID